MIISLQNLLSLPHFLHIVTNLTCSAFKKYHMTKQLILYISDLTSFSVKKFKSVKNVQSRQVKCGLREQIWCSMFKVDRCSMYPGSLPLISNESVPGHKQLFNVHRCSMYTGVQFDRFHCTLISDPSVNNDDVSGRLNFPCTCRYKRFSFWFLGLFDVEARFNNTCQW